MKNTKIFLIGFMGAGKSTVARCLNKEYNLELIEMDEQIEKEEGMEIPEIFEKKGEEYFRTLESQLLERIEEKSNAVISCGGGTVMREKNVREMKKQGRIVFLTAEPETVLDRVKSRHNRPLLEGNMNVEYIQRLMESRRASYESAADIRIKTDGRSTGEICKEIAEFIWRTEENN